MIIDELRNLIAIYKQQGGEILGGELALIPSDAALFIDKLTELGIVVLGIDGWLKTEYGFMQDLKTDFAVDEDMLNQTDRLEKSANTIKSFIQDKLSPNVVRVSFTLDIPEDWDIY
jgi:hypothetical protein